MKIMAPPPRLAQGQSQQPPRGYPSKPGPGRPSLMTPPATGQQQRTGGSGQPGGQAQPRQPPSQGTPYGGDTAMWGTQSQAQQGMGGAPVKQYGTLGWGAAQPVQPPSQGTPYGAYAPQQQGGYDAWKQNAGITGTPSLQQFQSYIAQNNGGRAEMAAPRPRTADMRDHNFDGIDDRDQGMPNAPFMYRPGAAQPIYAPGTSREYIERNPDTLPNYRPGAAQPTQPQLQGSGPPADQSRSGRGGQTGAQQPQPQMFGRPPSQSVFGDLRGGWAAASPQDRPPPFQMGPVQGPWGQSEDPFGARFDFVQRAQQQNALRQQVFNNGGFLRPASWNQNPFF